MQTFRFRLQKSKAPPGRGHCTLSPGSRVPVLCVFCPLSLVLGRMFRLLDYGSTLSGVTASGQGATGPLGCPWGHPAHAVAPVALEQYLMGGLCRAVGPCRLSRPPDPGKPRQWQVTPLIHGLCCGGPPQPENAVGRGPPNQWVPAGVGQLGGSQLSVGTPKHGWVSEMQCLRLVGLHPPRRELGLHWVADDKHPPGEGSQHFEPWQ